MRTKVYVNGRLLLILPSGYYTYQEIDRIVGQTKYTIQYVSL